MLLNKETFEKLASEGKIKILFPLRPIRNCLFISYTTSSDKTKMVKCSVEEYRHGEYGYKVFLNPELKGYEYRDIYTSDLVSLINSGTAKAIIKL